MRNSLYFLKETITLFKIEKAGNFLSIISIALILTILGACSGAISLGTNWIDILEREADIAIFTKEGQEDFVKSELEKIPEIEKLYRVSEEEARKEMESILGDESTALTVVSENPFLPYLKLTVSLENREVVLKALENITGIDHIRDNREAASKLTEIIQTMKLIGSTMILAIGFISVIVVSHIIRQDLTLHRKERTTLRLLGAGEGFLNTPYIIKAFLITFISAFFASLFITVAISLFYKSVGLFILPLPKKQELLDSIIKTLAITSIILGTVASFVSLFSKRA